MFARLLLFLLLFSRSLPLSDLNTKLDSLSLVTGDTSYKSTFARVVRLEASCFLADGTPCTFLTVEHSDFPPFLNNLHHLPIPGRSPPDRNRRGSPRSRLLRTTPTPPPSVDSVRRLSTSHSSAGLSDSRIRNLPTLLAISIPSSSRQLVALEPSASSHRLRVRRRPHFLPAPTCRTAPA